MSSHNEQPVIRASELGEYIYCARAWWLKRAQGVQSHNVEVLRSGAAAHDRHGRGVATVQTQRRLVTILLAGAALLALAAVLLALLGGAG